MVLGISDFQSGEEKEMIRTFLSRRVDAIYLSGAVRCPDSRRMLLASGIPVVEGVNLGENPIAMAVGHSNLATTFETTRHLMERGYDPIGYIGARLLDNDRARDRRRGYETALLGAGRTSHTLLGIEAALDLTAGAAAMRILLTRSTGAPCSATAMCLRPAPTS